MYLTLHTINNQLVVMASIKEQSKAILEHPFFADCISKANSGDNSGFERLFNEIFCHSWEKLALEASRVYGTWHRANHCDVKREIRNMPPPVNLDLRLPFVHPQQKKPVAVIKTIHKPIKTLPNPNQLQIDFPEALIRHLKIA